MRSNPLWRHRRALFLVVLLFVGAFSGVGYVLARVPLPEADPPVETTFLYDAAGDKLAELSGGEDRTSVPLTEVSEHLVHAVLAAEDRDFFRHGGVNLSAITRAAWADVRGRPLQGGSTITQQYVKLVYLGTERTIVRKLKEATLAIKLERKLSKEEILERYLNRIYFGRGAHGAQAAANAYFEGRDVSDLTIPEAAYLAGLIRAPEAADASSDPEEADRRRNLVLRAMVEEGYLSSEDRERIEEIPVAAYTRERSQVVHDKITDPASGTQYFVEHVRRILAERFGDARVNGGGLRVYTSLDLDLQRAAQRAVYEETLNQPGDPAGALVAVDRDGFVRAMVGGRDWEADDKYARVNFAVGAAGGGSGRQPGSSFKPFVLAAAVADGYTVESAFRAPAKIIIPKADNGKDWPVRNYEDQAFGRLNLIEATVKSSNTVYAQLIDAIGAERVASFAARAGITSELSPVPSITLGTPSVSVLDMAASYLTFATRGERVEPSVIVRVTDAEGRVLWEPPRRRTRVMEPEEADIVNHVLRQVVERGTGTRARLDTPVAGKTGTTQSYGDAWFVGYTPGLSTAVWMGYPEGQERPLEDVHGIDVTGGTLPAQAWKAFMDVATDDDRYRGEFVEPDDLGGALVPESGRIRVEESTTTTAAPAEESTTTSTSAPEGESTTTSSVPDGESTTTTEGEGDGEETTTSTTSTTSAVVPEQPG